MKIEIDKILNNWTYWIQEKKLMSKDVYVVVGNEKFELLSISRVKGTISYEADSKAVEVPATTVEAVIFNE